MHPFIIFVQMIHIYISENVQIWPVYIKKNKKNPKNSAFKYIVFLKLYKNALVDHKIVILNAFFFLHRTDGEFMDMNCSDYLFCITKSPHVWHSH